jgi:hypothetical protein
MKQYLGIGKNDGVRHNRSVPLLRHILPALAALPSEAMLRKALIRAGKTP